MENEQLYSQRDTIVALCDNRHDKEGNCLWRFWIVSGGTWPHWFLSKNTWTPRHGGAYMTMPQMYHNEKPQLIYIYNDYVGNAQMYVHTPNIDPTNYYAAFHSKDLDRDSALWGTAENWNYIGHRRWCGKNKKTYDDLEQNNKQKMTYRDLGQNNKQNMTYRDLGIRKDYWRFKKTT